MLFSYHSKEQSRCKHVNTIIIVSNNISGELAPSKPLLYSLFSYSIEEGSACFPSSCAHKLLISPLSVFLKHYPYCLDKIILYDSVN